MRRTSRAKTYTDAVETVSPYLTALVSSLKGLNATNYSIRLKGATLALTVGKKYHRSSAAIACQEIGHIIYHGGETVTNAGMKTLSVVVRSSTQMQELLEARGVFTILSYALDNENEQLVLVACLYTLLNVKNGQALTLYKRVWAAHAMYFLLAKRHEIHAKHFSQDRLQQALRRVAEDREWEHFPHNDAEEILHLMGISYETNNITQAATFPPPRPQPTVVTVATKQ